LINLNKDSSLFNLNKKNPTKNHRILEYHEEKPNYARDPLIM